MRRRNRLLQLASAAIILAAATILLFPSGPVVRNVHASTVTIDLMGNASSGWNGTKPGPMITVHQGDTVTVSWSSQDGAPHQFLLDIDKDGLDTTDCSTTADPCAPNTSSSSTGGSVTFTASIAGSFTYYCTVHPTMTGSFNVLSPPGFAMTSNPSSLAIKQGSSGTSTITFTSENGFSGTISLAPSVSPAGPTPSVNPTSVTISPGSPATSTLTVSTTVSTTPGPYTVTVDGTSGSTTNMTTIAVTVTIPDFSVVSGPTSLAIAQGATATTTITLSSLSEFKGNLTLTGTVSPSGPGISFSPSSVSLSSGGRVTSTMTVSAVGGTSGSVATGSYTVTVTVTNGTLSHSTTVPVTIVSASSPGASLPLTVLVGAAVVIIAAVAVTVFLVRRKPTR